MSAPAIRNATTSKLHRYCRSPVILFPFRRSTCWSPCEDVLGDVPPARVVTTPLGPSWLTGSSCAFEGFCERRPPLDPQLLVDGVELVLDRAVREVQAGGDVLVGKPCRRHAGDLELPGRQRRPSGGGDREGRGAGSLAPGGQPGGTSLCPDCPAGFATLAPGDACIRGGLGGQQQGTAILEASGGRLQPGGVPCCQGGGVSRPGRSQRTFDDPGQLLEGRGYLGRPSEPRQIGKCSRLQG